MARIQFGILVLPFQVTDVSGPLDVLSCCSKGMMEGCKAVIEPTDEVLNRALDIQFHHVGPTLEPVELTAGFRILPTVTFADCPKLDYLIIGGPGPDFFGNLPQSYTAFVSERLPELKTIFTTCTGGGVLAATGLLEGKTATANHQFIPVLEKFFPNVKWSKEQWVIDGKFWTAGGACAGMDMMAHWALQQVGRETAEVGFALLDYEPRDINGKLIPLKFGLRTGN